MAQVAASPTWSRSRSTLAPVPWALLGRVAAGAAQTLGVAAVFWLLAALPGVLSERASTAGHGGRPTATVAVRR